MVVDDVVQRNAAAVLALLTDSEDVRAGTGSQAMKLLTSM